MSQYRSLVDVHLLLLRASPRSTEQVLLTLRRHGYGAGLWHCPSGKLDEGESLVDAVIREAREEVGVAVRASDVTLVHTAHALASGPEARIGFFFTARRWEGEPTNCEPDKCNGIAWYDLDNLPEVIPYPLAGITNYRTGTTFSVLNAPGHRSPPL